MIDIIQVYKSKERFIKDEYKADKTELLHQWDDRLKSRNGYLEDNTLYLPDIGKEEPGLEKANTIIILDIYGFDPFPLRSKEQPRWFKDYYKSHVLFANEKPICFYKLAKSLTFEIFKIEKKHLDSFDLSLNYSAHSMSIGVPERDNHKIAEVTLNKPVRYRLNGKSDSSGSSGAQRTYAEYDYLIEYVGQANKIVFKELSKIETVKNIPKEYKMVDERKILK